MIEQGPPIIIVRRGPGNYVPGAVQSGALYSSTTSCLFPPLLFLDGSLSLLRGSHTLLLGCITGNAAVATPACPGPQRNGRRIIGREREKSSERERERNRVKEREREREREKSSERERERERET